MTPSTAEDLLWPSQRADWHCQPQEMRSIDLVDDERTLIRERFAAGDFEACPVQITARNRTNAPLWLHSQWDGVHLEVDVVPSSPAKLPASDALLAAYRYHYERHPRLVYLAFALVFVVMIAFSLVLAAATGVATL